jgi:hypothetical protein
MQRVKSKGLQIFQKPRSHLQIIEARRMTKSKFHIEDPQPWSDLRTSFSGAFCRVHECKERKNCSSCVQNIRHHCTKFNRLGDQGPRICESLAKRILVTGCLKDILNTHVKVVCCATYFFHKTFLIHQLTTAPLKSLFHEQCQLI